MSQRSGTKRRTFIAGVGALSASCASARTPSAGATREKAEVTPGEDLMQEHGVLERILLVYHQAASRLEQPQSVEVISKAATIVRRFVEDYHEKLEEEFVFPRLEAAKKESDLVAVLRLQHQRGRELTDEILRRSSGGSSDATSLAALIGSFEGMYRPHAAREDTVLFPAFREVMGAGYHELGETFEEKEEALLGEGGFARIVGEIAALEEMIGIADLSSFTPPQPER